MLSTSSRYSVPLRIKGIGALRAVDSFGAFHPFLPLIAAVTANLSFRQFVALYIILPDVLHRTAVVARGLATREVVVRERFKRLSCNYRDINSLSYVCPSSRGIAYGVDDEGSNESTHG